MANLNITADDAMLRNELSHCAGNDSKSSIDTGFRDPSGNNLRLTQVSMP